VQPIGLGTTPSDAHRVTNILRDLALALSVTSLLLWHLFLWAIGAYSLYATSFNPEPVDISQFERNIIPTLLSILMLPSTLIASPYVPILVLNQ
jgi:hypothetical protein